METLGLGVETQMRCRQFITKREVEAPTALFVK